MENDVTVPCVRGSKMTVATVASAVLSRRREALKNWLMTDCSDEPEQPGNTAEATTRTQTAELTCLTTAHLLLHHSSSSFSTSRAMDTTLSSPSMLMSVTPCVARPMARTSLDRKS